MNMLILNEESFFQLSSIGLIYIFSLILKNEIKRWQKGELII